jgi:hypothetical protein
MIELLLPYGFDTLEYSWVKAIIGICTLVDYSMAKKRQQHHYATSLPGAMGSLTNHLSGCDVCSTSDAVLNFVCVLLHFWCHLGEIAPWKHFLEVLCPFSLQLPHFSSDDFLMSAFAFCGLSLFSSEVFLMSQ